MSLFSKREIRQLIEQERTFSRDDNNEIVLEHQIQPASFDVTVGRIYVPPQSGDEVVSQVVDTLESKMELGYVKSVGEEYRRWKRDHLPAPDLQIRSADVDFRELAIAGQILEKIRAGMLR